MDGRGGLAGPVDGASERLASRAAPRMAGIAPRVVSIVLGDATSAGEAARVLSAAAWWPQAIDLASLWRVIPELRRRVTALGIALDEESRRVLRARSVTAAAESTSIVHRAAVALQRLADGGVAAAAFKGVGVIGNLYGSAGQRMVSDIDLLVARDQIERACAILKELGFAPATEDLADYVDFLRARPAEGALAGQYALVLADASQMEIDLHFRLGTHVFPALEVAAIVARSEVREIFRLPIRVVAPMDAIVLTVHHVLRNQFAPSSAVKDLCDLAAWWRVRGECWAIDELVEHARRCGLAASLLAAWTLLVDLDGATPARDGVERLAAAVSRDGRVDAARLADLFWLQMHEAPLNGDLLRLLSMRATWQFLARRLRRGAETASFARRLQAHVNRPPLPSPVERVRRLCRAIAGLSPRKLAAYRALLRAHRTSESH